MSERVVCIAQEEMTSKPSAAHQSSRASTLPTTEKSRGVRPSRLILIASVFFTGAFFSSTNRSASARNAWRMPAWYVCMPDVSKCRVGMPLRFSMTRATPLKSVPVMAAMGEPNTAMNVGSVSFAASTTSEMYFSSLPRMASYSRSPEMKIRLSEPYQRGSSWVA